MNENVEFRSPDVAIPRSLSEIAELVGSTVWVTLSRPEKANALDVATLEALLTTLDAAERTPEARVLVLSGAGRNFCAGADLMALRAGGPEGIRHLLELIKDFTTRLERSRLTVVAAVHGAARAGGLELTLACDVVLAARSATFGDAHLANGLLPGGGSTARLPRTVGWQRAKWLILSAASIDAVTACDWGLVFEVVEDGDLNSAVRRLADRLTHIDSATVQRAKRLLSMVGEQPLSASLEAEITTLEAHCHSTAFRHGIDRFLCGGRARIDGDPVGPEDQG
ncbi:enoyl-CoA hydratase/isomerase family protein [Mesorhizobium sp. M1163]|uniref:enoyl-CoA hydratase/isomerase family protein n=1 Tax=Mesorhizobium sp. M1163 TaxID=2957065 RepID=UPI0033386D39